jgi:hypothetical protein
VSSSCAGDKSKGLPSRVERLRLRGYQMARVEEIDVTICVS